jgi:competence ComEA-like helix-hairpin-helix protein
MKSDSTVSHNEFKGNGDKAAKLFTFDPNTVTEQQLQQLGLREKTAATFMKFRAKGFVFRQKEDLKKVYGISEKLYNELLPYILIESKPEDKIPEKEETNFKSEVKSVQKPKIIVDINSADSAALVELNGIGPAFAKKIIKYRNLLGGFISADQLKEVYGFTPELFEKIKSDIIVNASQIRKINLNTDDFKTVNRHPYLDYETTRNIFTLKRSKALTADDVKKLLDNDGLFQKLMPYLAF